MATTPLARAMALEKRMNVESLQIKEIEEKIEKIEEDRARLLGLLSEVEESEATLRDLCAIPHQEYVAIAVFTTQNAFGRQADEIKRMQELARIQHLKLMDEEKNLKEQFKIDSAELDRLFNAVCPTAMHAGIQ
jgi:alkyl hydroperoxide reductase subunit AhpC